MRIFFPYNYSQEKFNLNLVRANRVQQKRERNPLKHFDNFWILIEGMHEFYATLIKTKYPACIQNTLFLNPLCTGE